MLDVLYVPRLTRSLIYASKLVKDGYVFVGDDESVRIYKQSNMNLLLGICFLNNDLWRMNCQVMLNSKCLTVESNLSLKRSLTNEGSSMLWHRRLGHINKQRLEILVKEQMLPTLDFNDMQNCIDCWKGKLTNTRKIGSTRSLNLLEVVHSDVCGPFSTQTICKNAYFVSFIVFLDMHMYI